MAWSGANTTEFESLARAKDGKYDKGTLKVLIALLKTPAPTKSAVQTLYEGIPAEKKRKYQTALSYLLRHFWGVGEVARGNLRLQAFNGYPDEQAKMDRAVVAMTRCSEVVAMCQKACGKVIDNGLSSKTPSTWSKQEQKATELFKKWLDDSRSTTSVNRVRRVFTVMAEALRTETWDIVLYGTPEIPDPENLGGAIPDCYAFVRPSENAYRIYLGQLFWKNSDAKIDTPTVSHAFAAATPELWQTEKKLKSALDAAVVTTVHELCHITAISGATAITDVRPSPYDWAVCRKNAKDAPNLALTNAENYAMFGSSLLMEQMFF